MIKDKLVERLHNLTLTQSKSLSYLDIERILLILGKAGWKSPEEVQELRCESREWGIKKDQAKLEQARKEGQDDVLGLLDTDYPDEAGAIRKALKEEVKG